jgi:hypothetical protein
MHSESIDPQENAMVSAALVRSEDDLRDFYRWLVSRAQEEEKNGNDNHARCYQELAAGIKKVYYGKYLSG